MRKCSGQGSVRTPISPPYFTTMRSKLVQGTKSITCENRVRPEYMAVPRLKKPKSGKKLPPKPKPCSSRHQKKRPRNPYVAALFYKITLAEPDSSGRRQFRRAHAARRAISVRPRGHGAIGCANHRCRDGRLCPPYRLAFFSPSV